MGHWILYYIKDVVLYFFDCLGQPLDIYGLDMELLFTAYTGDKVRVFNSPLQYDTYLLMGGPLEDSLLACFFPVTGILRLNQVCWHPT